MKKRLFSIPILSAVLLTASAFVKISSGGIIGFTGSPGENTCANCHGGGGGTTSVSVVATPAFTGNQYTPGQTYTMNLTIANSSFALFGFDCEILTTTNTNAGSMTTPLTGVQFANSGARKNATHTTPKAGTGSATFSFVWVAPASGTARVYVAGNAIDGTGSTGGDKPGNILLTLTPDATTGLKETVSSAARFNVFPNPTNGDFRMQYTLLNDGNLKATLVDLRGEEVAVLLNEDQTSGIHSVGANLPDDLAAGIYMVKLSLNGLPYTQRMLVKQ